VVSLSDPSEGFGMKTRNLTESSKGPIGANDRKAHLVSRAAGAGQPIRVSAAEARHVTVVGGGLAGVAAAASLAERGVSVTLHEAGPVLGGRLSSWSDHLATGEPIQMERGFHAFFRQYYNARSLLRRVDPSLRFLKSCDDYPLFGPNGSFESFTGLPKKPPFNLLALVKRTPTLGIRDLLAIDGDAAAEMLAYDGDDTYARMDSVSAAAYLDSVKFPEEARRMLFEVFAHSFFNPQDQMSAAEMLMMFHLYFCGSAEGILFDVLDESFGDAVWTPMTRYLQSLGVVIHLNSLVTKLPEPTGTDGVVLAITVNALQGLIQANPWMLGYSVGSAHTNPLTTLDTLDKPEPVSSVPVDREERARLVVSSALTSSDDDTSNMLSVDQSVAQLWADSIAQLDQAPPFAVWRLWLDCALDPSRQPFAGTAGLGIIDNISVVDRYQGEAHRWALRTGGSVVELHGYALPESHHHDEARIKAELLEQLHALYPETVGAQIIEERFLLRNDCPSFSPGSFAHRPPVATPHPRLKLAGDLVRLPFPSALMERATASGFLAANQLLADTNVIEEPIWSIPARGSLASLQAWQRKRKAAVA
jgi:carotenoid phi-ring synthase / carotenoid chi-ring synthase